MATSIYVGNLPWSTTEEELSDLFAAHGPVLSAKIITDRETGRSRGFALRGNGERARPRSYQQHRWHVVWRPQPQSQRGTAQAPTSESLVNFSPRLF